MTISRDILAKGGRTVNLELETRVRNQKCDENNPPVRVKRKKIDSTRG
jgi:hypothetical protein